MVDLFSEPISKLTDTLIYVAKTTADFNPQLEQLTTTLSRITSNVNEITRLNRRLDRPEQDSKMITSIIEEAEILVNKCLELHKANYWKKFTHSRKLEKLNNKLLRVFQLEAQVDQCRDGKETLLGVNDVKLKIDDLASNMEKWEQRATIGASRRRQHEQIEREKLGWKVPKLPKGIVGFEEPLKKLKAKVVADTTDDEGFSENSVVVLSAAGGCGKTTLAKMLCHDSEIKDVFGENIFFVTASQTPNFMVIANDLFGSDFSGNEDARNKLESFLGEKVSRPILLVLDDVWIESFIDNFAFDIGRYKIVVTSRMVSTKYDVFHFDPLSDEDATTLFCRSAFTQDKNKRNPSIDKDLVNKLIKRKR